MGGGFRGMGAGFHGAPMRAVHAGPMFAQRSVAFRHHGFVNHRRFAFRHHHVRHFRTGVFVASIDDGCFVVRQVWTPWGWRWRRVWVCG
jgi:hypothetical protein